VIHEAIPATGSQAIDHELRFPGGCLYYQTRGSGPVLMLLGGGPSNADTLAPLADVLAAGHTVVTYDRRGYSRSRLDDPAEPATISVHGDDLRLLIGALGPGSVSVFGTSFGALIALDLAARAPDSFGTMIVHEPPFGQLLTGDERQPFDLNVGAEPDAGAALNAIAASIGVKREAAGDAAATRAQAPSADVELFISRDVPAIGSFHLDLDRLRPAAGRITVTASEDGRGFYPYECAQRLADSLGTPLVELPGNHAGMIQHPAAFAGRLEALLRG
jgi:pimeloyl-ACP methyl ester carboxylesterase